MMLLLVFLIGCTFASGQEAKLNFPLQGGVRLEDRDKPVFEFEGVDYDSLPTKLKDKSTDCDAQNNRCIRHQVALTPICAVTFTGYWRNFHNICEFQLQNCLAMRDKGRGKYGTNIDSGWLFLQGEGVGCGHDFRRLRDNGLVKSYLKLLHKTA